jgi:hypothetical protein
LFTNLDGGVPTVEISEDVGGEFEHKEIEDEDALEAE